MKKIAIATFYSERNYGAVLQAYALQEAIKLCNCNVEFLQYHEIIDHSRGQKTGKLLSRLGFLYGVKGDLRKYRKLLVAGGKRDGLFDGFQYDLLQVSEYPLYDIEDAKRIESLYDAFIAGSDMVWTPMGQSLDFYFLTFAPQNKRLSYAPSLTGTSSFDSQTNDKMKNYLLGINSLCFREIEGSEYSKKIIEREAPVVLDPTFLLSKEEWADRINLKSTKDEPYLLCYLFGEVSSLTKKHIKNFSRKHGLAIKYISLSYQEVLYEQEQGRTGAYGPREFLEMYYNADFVVTNTFHGFVFSLIMEKPFAVLHRGKSNKWSKNEGRISSILNLIGCDDRYINSDTEIPASFYDLSYDKINQKLEQLRNNSKAYLLNMLSNVEECAEKELHHTSIASVPARTCTGCLACVEKCPHHCISIEKDEEGFCVPKIEKQLCVECSLCTKVCPAISTNNGRPISAAFAAFGKTDVDESASGGAFFTLARRFITRQNGVVVGCILDDKLDAKHVCATTIEELIPMQNSKYIQSDMRGIYSHIKVLIKQGRKVLFSGTPCQVSAVKKFIGETELLYTIDIVCHGVPSPEYWKKYIHSQKEPVLTYKFRDRKNRSKNKSTYYSTLHYSSRGEKRVPSSDDVYFSTYLKGINFRYSCYYCNYANTKREGDITVGDCDSWNYGENPFKSESRNFISINTPRGEELFENAKDDIEASPITVRDEVLVNRQLRHPSVKPHERDDFYVNVFSMPFSIFEKKYNKRSFMLVLKKIAAKIIE